MSIFETLGLTRKQASPQLPYATMEQLDTPDQAPAFDASMSGDTQRPNAINTALKPPGGFMNTVGQIGDVLAALGGRTGVYGPYVEQQQEKVRLEQKRMQERGLLNAKRQAVSIFVQNPKDMTAFGKMINLGVSPKEAFEIREGMTSANSIEIARNNRLFERDENGKLVETIGVEVPEITPYQQQVLANQDANRERKNMMTPYQQVQASNLERRTRVAENRLDQQSLKVSGPRSGASGKNDIGGGAFAIARTALGDAVKALDQLKSTGSITYAGQSAAQRAGSFAYQNLPFAERMANPVGFNARQKLEAVADSVAMRVLPVLASANGMTVNSRMMDTPKEVERIKASIINASDYEAARDIIRGVERDMAIIERFAGQNQTRQTPTRQTARPIIDRRAPVRNRTPVQKTNGGGTTVFRYNPATGQLDRGN